MDDKITLINNDGYGVSELKRAYQGFTLKGLIIAVTIHIAFIAVYMLVAYINEAKSKDIPHNNERKIIVVNPDFLEPPPPITDNETPVIKDNLEKLKDLSQLQPLPMRKELADDVILKTQDELNNLTDQLVSRDGDSLMANYDPNNVKIDNDKVTDKLDKDNTKTIDLDKNYKDYEVEKAPECINLAQVKSSIKYPELAIEIGTEGKVTAKVLVGKDGRVLQVGKMTGPDVFYDEVKDKVADLQFTPGMQNNTPVNVWVNVPFVFNLK